MPTLHIHIHQVAFKREEEKSVPQKEKEMNVYTAIIFEIKIYVFILLGLSMIIYYYIKQWKKLNKIIFTAHLNINKFCKSNETLHLDLDILFLREREETF